MVSIDVVTIGVADMAAAERLHTEAFDVADRVRSRVENAPTSGFRGFVLSLLVAQPTDVDTLIDRALGAGATILRPAKKSLWGYGGAVQGPDATVWTVASSSKKNTGPATGEIDELVLQLGVADPAVSQRFYVDHGVKMTKSYGRRYVEFDTGPVKLTLNRRGELAKTAGVAPEGAAPHRLTIGSDAGSFVDPDGFIWEEATR